MVEPDILNAKIRELTDWQTIAWRRIANPSVTRFERAKFEMVSRRVMRNCATWTCLRKISLSNTRIDREAARTCGPQVSVARLDSAAWRPSTQIIRRAASFLIALASLKRRRAVTAKQRTFCSCNGTAHFHLRQARRVLSSPAPGLG